jgi:hypothetical protein
MSVFGPLADKVPLPLLMILTGGVLVVVAIVYRLNPVFYKKTEQSQSISN